MIIESKKIVFLCLFGMSIMGSELDWSGELDWGKQPENNNGFKHFTEWLKEFQERDSEQQSIRSLLKGLYKDLFAETKKLDFFKDLACGSNPDLDCFKIIEMENERIAFFKEKYNSQRYRKALAVFQNILIARLEIAKFNSTGLFGESYCSIPLNNLSDRQNNEILLYKHHQIVKNFANLTAALKEAEEIKMDALVAALENGF